MTRRETPRRPVIWGTTPQFLAQFGLKELRDLPRREDLLLELPVPRAAAAEVEPEAAPERAEEPPGEAAAEAPDERQE